MVVTHSQSYNILCMPSFLRYRVAADPPEYALQICTAHASRRTFQTCLLMTRRNLRALSSHLAGRYASVSQSFAANSRCAHSVGAVLAHSQRAVEHERTSLNRERFSSSSSSCLRWLRPPRLERRRPLHLRRGLRRRRRQHR